MASRFTIRLTATRVLNTTRNVALADHAEFARSPWSRFRGLMAQKAIEPGYGLVIEPCNSIHMFFMRFAIDAVFLDKEGRVVYIADSIKPWRISRIVRKAKRVIEMPSGTCQRTGTKPGDLVAFN